MDSIKVSEIFESIQGEGAKAGIPMLFIRTSGCTRKCSWCDTKYHEKGKRISVEKLVKRIKESKLNNICWTGGEPLLQTDMVVKVIKNTKRYRHHLETNGDLIDKLKTDFHWKLFEYIAISPKDLKTAMKAKTEWNLGDKSDIKVVTDMDKVNRKLIQFATMLMPLTTYDKEKDLKIQRKVWQYCVEKGLKFTPRYQVWIWRDKKKGI